MGKLEVDILNLEYETYLSIGFPGGESIFAFFFPDPESREELEQQIPHRFAQAIIMGCDRECPDCDESCTVCGRARFWFTLAFGLSIAAFYPAFPLWVGVTYVALVLISLGIFLRWYQRTKPERLRRQEQRKYLLPIRKELYSYAEKKDFRGALEYALSVADRQDVPLLAA